MTQETLTIGLLGRWAVGLVVLLLSGATGYWVHTSDKRAERLLEQVETIAGSLVTLTRDGAVTQQVVGDLADEVGRIRDEIYSQADATRDRERQAEIDRAQTMMLEQLQQRFDRIEPIIGQPR